MIFPNSTHRNPQRGEQPRDSTASDPPSLMAWERPTCVGEGVGSHPLPFFPPPRVRALAPSSWSGTRSETEGHCWVSLYRESQDPSWDGRLSGATLSAADAVFAHVARVPAV